MRKVTECVAFLLIFVEMVIEGVAFLLIFRESVTTQKKLSNF